MAKKKTNEVNEEIKEELTNEIVEDSAEEVHEDHCDCCDHDHEGCDCGCEDMFLPYDFDETVHNSTSFANIFSIVSKVVAIMYFIVGTYNSVNSLIYYKEYYTDLTSEFYVEFISSFFTSVLLVTFAFVAIGEVVNLLNRIKESLY